MNSGTGDQPLSRGFLYVLGFLECDIADVIESEFIGGFVSRDTSTASRSGGAFCFPFPDPCRLVRQVKQVAG